MIQEKVRITTGNHFGDCREHESGLYYLQSRYYDPVVGRFINADGYVSTGQGIIGYNMFAYCLNNPINYVDRTGKNSIAAGGWLATMWWLTVIDGPIPVGDIVYATGTVVIGIWTAAQAYATLSLVANLDDDNSLPTTGEPNSSQELTDENGELKQKRYYGPDGKAEKDIDYKHPGNKHPFPHEHKWDWSKTPPRQKWTPMPK